MKPKTEGRKMKIWQGIQRTQETQSAAQERLVSEGTEILLLVCSQALEWNWPKLEVSANDPGPLRCRTQLGGPRAPGRVRCLLLWSFILRRTRTFPACSGGHIPGIRSALFSLHGRSCETQGHRTWLVIACGFSGGLVEPGRMVLPPHFLPRFSSAEVLIY